jgi:hypothetical protein
VRGTTDFVISTGSSKPGIVSDVESLVASSVSARHPYKKEEARSEIMTANMSILFFIFAEALPELTDSSFSIIA